MKEVKKYHESDRYLAWIRSQFPDQEEKVMELWRERETVLHRLVELEMEIRKYSPPTNQ